MAVSKSGRCSLMRFVTCHKSSSNKETEPTADVLFFDVDRGLSKMVTIKESESTEIRVELAESPAISGRVVDSISGEPVSGVRISGNGSVHRLILGATTNSDGFFLLEHVPRDGVSFSFIKDGFKHHHERYQFLGENQDKIQLDVSDIKLFKEFAYDRPEKPDVTGLIPKESVDKLVAHIAKELGKMPQREPSLSWNSSDPDTMFKAQLAKDVSAIMDNIFDENGETEFQVVSTLRIFRALSTPQGGEMIAYSPQVKRMKQVLLENLDQGDVFDFFTKFRFTRNSPGEYEIALDNNQSSKVKLWATQKLLSELERDLASSAQLGFQRTGAAEFQKRLRSVEKAWRLGLGELRDENSDGVIFQARIRGSMKRVVDLIEEKPHDEKRLSVIKAIIAEITE